MNSLWNECSVCPPQNGEICLPCCTTRESDGQTCGDYMPFMHNVDEDNLVTFDVTGSVTKAGLVEFYNKEWTPAVVMSHAWDEQVILPDSNAEDSPPAEDWGTSCTGPMCIPPQRWKSKFGWGSEASNVERLKFRVTLIKKEGEDLGIDIEFRTESSVLPILGIIGGVAAQWNRANPQNQLDRGDSIIEVNGAWGNGAQMLERCRNDQVLELTLLRAPKAPPMWV